MLAFLASEWFWLGILGPDPRLLKGIWVFRVAVILLGGMAGWGLISKRSLFELFRENACFNLFLLLTAILLFLLTNRLQPGQHKVLRMIWVMALAMQGLRVFYLGVVRLRLKGWKAGLATTLLGFFMLFSVGEGICIFVAETSGHLRTFAAINWAHRYQKPINSWRYRDQEYDWPALAGRKKIMVLGDSFTEGAGIKRVEDRFSNRLGQKLGDGYLVLNLGRGGADTPRELELLDSFPQVPDLLVLGYFGNDIQGRVPPEFMDVQLNTEYFYLPEPLRFLVYHSHLLDYLCWKLPWPARGDYLGELARAYRDPEIMAQHLQDLGAVADWCEVRGVKMAVLIFPFMQAVEQSSFFAEPVGGYFRELGIPVLDLRPVLQGYDPGELVVNGNDGHPNVFANHLVADTLFGFLRQGILP